MHDARGQDLNQYPESNASTRTTDFEFLPCTIGIFNKYLPTSYSFAIMINEFVFVAGWGGGGGGDGKKKITPISTTYTETVEKNRNWATICTKKIVK